MIEPLLLHVEASWCSPWVSSVHFALCHKGLPFTTAISMLRPGAGLIDEMHGRTVTGTAPVLQHGAFWIAESLPIVEYLEDAFPEPRVLPIGLEERARARQILTWLRLELGALYRERPTEDIFYPTLQPPLSTAAQYQAEELVRVARKFCTGAAPIFGAIGIVDADLAFAVMRLVVAKMDIPTEVAAHAAFVWGHPAMRGFVEHRRPPNRM